MISSIRRYWRSAYCDKCLIGSNFSHPVSAIAEVLPNYNLSAYNNATLKFFSQLKSTVSCISKYVLNSDTSPLDPVNFPPEGSIHLNESVCRDCHFEYTQLFQAYRFWIHEISATLRSSYSPLPEATNLEYRELCVDVVDALNRTQFVWTRILCCSSTSSLNPLAALIPIFTCATVGVIFHTILVCILHEPSHVTVYLQSRVEANNGPIEEPSLIENTNVGIVRRSSTLLRKTSFAPVTRNIT